MYAHVYVCQIGAIAPALRTHGHSIPAYDIITFYPLFPFILYLYLTVRIRIHTKPVTTQRVNLEIYGEFSLDFNEYYTGIIAGTCGL